MTEAQNTAVSWLLQYGFVEVMPNSWTRIVGGYPYAERWTAAGDGFSRDDWTQGQYVSVPYAGTSYTWPAEEVARIHKAAVEERKSW